MCLIFFEKNVMKGGMATGRATRLPTQLIDYAITLMLIFDNAPGGASHHLPQKHSEYDFFENTKFYLSCFFANKLTLRLDLRT